MDANRYRVIKISKEALWEFIYESLIDHQEEFFDVELTDITSHFDIDFQSGDFICLIHNSEDTKGDIISLPKQIDIFKLMVNMKDTTKSLYQENRYIELSLDEILEIQNQNSSIGK